MFLTSLIQDKAPRIKTKIINNKWQLIAWENSNFLFDIASFFFIELTQEEESDLSANNSKLLYSLENSIINQFKSISSEKKTSLKTISLNIIQSCNLACSYCFAKKGDYGNPSIMTREVAMKSIDYFIKGTQKLHVNFFGGEPFLNFNLLKDVISWANIYQGRISFSVTTNGTLLDQTKILYLRENKVAIKISYDGKKEQLKNRPMLSSQPKVHLVTKKINLYQKLINNYCSSYIRSTVLIDQSEKIKDLLIELSGKFQLALSFVENIKQISKQEIRDQVRAIKSTFLSYMISCYRANQLKEVLKILNISTLARRIKNHDRSQNFCGAGYDYFTVSSEGKIYLCHRFNEDKRMCIGDVYEGVNPSYMKQIKKYRSNDYEPCKSCWVRNLCQGGCLYEHNFSLSKNYLFCEIQRMEVELALFYIKLSS